MDKTKTAKPKLHENTSLLAFYARKIVVGNEFIWVQPALKAQLALEKLVLLQNNSSNTKLGGEEKLQAETLLSEIERLLPVDQDKGLGKLVSRLSLMQEIPTIKKIVDLILLNYSVELSRQEKIMISEELSEAQAKYHSKADYEALSEIYWIIRNHSNYN
ncbi:MAG: hypothetical protein AAB116_19845 [Candidatus Poribacteria bacterium]